jgi:superfamily II DNA or RNA helicase
MQVRRMKNSVPKKIVDKQKESVPYHRKPVEMSLESWQIALRKQFVTANNFNIKKLEGHPVFCDYEVYNPVSLNTYKVAIRDSSSQMNFCTCLDYKTNHLGTCKHIESVILVIQSRPKLAAIMKKGYTPPYSSVYIHYGKERKIKLRIGTSNSLRFKKLAMEYFDEEMTLTPSGFANFEKFRMIATTYDNDFRCYDDAMEYIIDCREKQKREKWIDQKHSNENSLNGLLSTTLFPYQQKGILFAAKAGRGMICDEMGLGKTIQAIGVAELHKTESGISSILIICPTSLKYQWESEIQRFTTNSVKVIEGLPHTRHEQYSFDAFYKIVSYHTLHNDLATINEIEFDLVILDEAQRIKNWKTKIAQSVKKIKSTYALVLTGTPLENKLEELYSIVQFIDPFKLGPYYQFLDHYQVKNETGRVVGYNHLHEISNLISDIMIRRTKKEVFSQLPERIDKNLFVSMTDKQMEMHQEFSDNVARVVNKWKRFGFLNEKDRQRLLINLNLMRMVCDSTYIVDQKTRHDTKITELMSILEEYLEGNLEKVVVFSQWERMTRLVTSELDERNIGYRYLNGNVPSRDRKKLFDDFNNNSSCRIFLSTDAGSTGLNLQLASMIINLDIPWNPAVLEQRIGRVHRYGQKKKVSVINFISSNTIEHRMLGVLNFKSSLFDGILNDGENSIFIGEDKFKEFMKTVEGITTSPIESYIQPLQLSEDVEEEREEMLGTTDSEQTDVYLGEAFPGDDDVPVISGTETVSTPSNASENLVIPDMHDLITQGLGFLGGLAKTLRSTEATKQLVSTLVEKDPTTGKTYMKIPVENEAIIADTLLLFGQLFRAVGKDM